MTVTFTTHWNGIALIAGGVRGTRSLRLQARTLEPQPAGITDTVNRSGDPPSYPTAANTVAFYVDPDTFEIWGYANTLSGSGITQLECDDFNILTAPFTMSKVGGTLSGHSLWHHAAVSGFTTGDGIAYCNKRDASDNFLGAALVDPGTAQVFSRSVLNRSDGGLWSNPDGTWVVLDGELYRTTYGIGTPITNNWLAADYGYHETVTISVDLRQPNPYQFQSVFFGMQGLTGSPGNGYQISIAQVENWLALSREGSSAAQVWGTSFAGPSWEDGGAAKHTMLITLNYVTRRITMSFDGVPWIDWTDPLTSRPIGTVLGLLADARASQTFDNVRVTGTGVTVDASPWVDYAYDIDTGDGSDVLTITADESSTGQVLEVRGVTYYDYNETPHYGAYPDGADWPASALLGAFGRIYQMQLPAPAPDVPSYSAAVLADGPYAFWRLGSTITADASGNGCVLTASGTTPTSVSGFSGDGDSARQWPADPGDGPAGSYTLYYPADAGINSANTTVTAIIKPTAGGGVLLNRDNDGGQRTFQIAVTTGGELHVDAWNGAASLRSLDTSGANLLDGNAHHIAVVFRNQASPLLEEMKLFVDGVLLATDSGMFGGLYTGANQNVVIGKHVVSTDPTASGYNHYNGVLDDIAYYTVALSSTQIANQAVSQAYVAPVVEASEEFTSAGYVTVSTGTVFFDYPLPTATPDIARVAFW